MNLVGPAREIAVASDRARNVDGLRDRNRLPIVEGLQAGKLVRVFLDQVRQTKEQAAALGRRSLSPRPVVEGGAGGLNGLFYVGGVSLGNLADLFSRGGIDGCEGLVPRRY